MRLIKSLVCSVIFITLVSLPTQIAAANSAKEFGKAHPFTVNDLPPGQLRNRLQDLPEAAKQNALSWMHRHNFTAQDLPMLRVDDNGGIFYSDPVATENEISTSNNFEPSFIDLSLAETFSLHSKPGASRTVFLDMDGRVVSGTAWNTAADPLYMRPYDSDGNEASFSQNELNAIAETWKRIAEDFAPFDIDVTTEDPGSFGPNVGVILITPKADEYGNEIYSCQCGGVAYVGVWGLNNFASTYQPALVFTDGVGTGPHNMSEAASHELGHNLGLSHDGTQSVGYYTGHGSGNVEWAPIMGVGYNATLTQWSKGEYAGANQTQDDLQIINNNLTEGADDHADSNFANATPLVIVGSSVSSTNPVSDAFNSNPANKGIIENRADVDLFSFTAGAGTLDLSIVPAWIENYVAQSNRGTNIDIQATLYDEFGTLLTSDNLANETDAQISFNVAGGNYVLAIEGVGMGDVLGTGYSDYGSLGQYFISGTVPLADPGVPSADFSFDCIELACNFDASASSDSDGSIESYAWTTTDASASTASGNPVSINFAAAGSYDVTLTITDNDAKTASVTKSVTVTVPTPPNAGFSFNCTDLSCSFDASESSDDGSITAYDWNFGDGTSGSGVNASHTYSSAGTFTVSLTVTDNENLSSTTTTTVTTNEPPPEPPAAPSNLTADVVTQGKGKKATVVSVELNWTDNADNETSFVIERCVETGKGKNKQCNFAGYATPSADVTTYSDPDPAAKAQYRVNAVNGVGESAYSNIVKL